MTAASAGPVLRHPVIAGYDGSASARNALAYAAGMARQIGRPLLVVHVVTSRVYCAPLTAPLGDPPCGDDVLRLEHWLLTEVDPVATAVGLRVHVHTRTGSPARELAALAAEHSADALVIGAPARFWRHVAGSVPGWLARHADCTVIVVP
jgi:nucleotide-binding universal stress UspA family protein